MPDMAEEKKESEPVKKSGQEKEPVIRFQEDVQAEQKEAPAKEAAKTQAEEKKKCEPVKESKIVQETPEDIVQEKSEVECGKPGSVKNPGELHKGPETGKFNQEPVKAEIVKETANAEKKASKVQPVKEPEVVQEEKTDSIKESEPVKIVQETPEDIVKK